MAKRIKRFLWVVGQGADTRVFPARDLHVLPMQITRDLRPNLVVVFADNTIQPVSDFVVAAENEPVPSTLVFRPLFLSVASGDKIIGLGFTVDSKTGVVEVAATLPSPTKNNFVIEVELNTPEQVFRQSIRVQVHRFVQQAWLTPSSLTVRLGPASKTRFTVRAQFDDDVVGDLTVDHEVTWHAVNAAHITAEGFLSPESTDQANDEFDITAQLPSQFGGLTTKPAKMRVAPSWKDEAIKATLVVGGGSLALRPPALAPNVLFFGDGFTAPALFETFVDLIVDRLKTNRLTRPYDLLTTSINFWRTHVPAPTAGVLSCRGEFYLRPVNGREVATPLPVALRPPDPEPGDPPRPWQIEHLIYVVGYPVPSDGAAGADSPDGLRSFWTSLVHPDFSARIADPTVVPFDLIAEWKKMANRTFIDEVDGFPGLSLGDPPAASVGAHSLLRVNRDRGGLRQFFSVLEADDGTKLPGNLPLGRLWSPADSDPVLRFDNTPLVIVFSPYPAGRPLNSSSAIGLSTKPQQEVFLVTKIAGRNSFSLLPILPPGLSAEIPHVVAHELGHSFGLGDEYQEFRETHPQFDDKDLDEFGNLQFETAPAQGVRPSHEQPLRSSRIKWNWQRISKAAIVAAPITAESGGTRFRVPIEPSDAMQFTVGDHVLLRVRKNQQPLGMEPRVELDSIHEAEVVDPLSPNAVMLKAADGSALAFAHLLQFVPGSLIYAPVPAPASVKTASYPYAEMIAKNIRDYIDTDKPLTVLPCVPDNSSEVVPLLPGVKVRGGFCGLCSPSIVGLYSGGNRYSCGVFHPTGSCLMGAHGPQPEIKSFCPVCRYVLVDFINPALHGTIDQDYEKIYPQA